MGSRPAPPYANLFMARKIYKYILKLINKYYKNRNMKLLLFKRFLDDLFFIFSGSTKTLHLFVEEVNRIHPNIQFTMEHTTIPNEVDPCDCAVKTSIPFLDTQVSIKNNRLSVDLYKKPTDRNQYLLPSSCHPPHCVENIPFSLAMRIVRICTENITRDQRLGELEQFLLDREYNLSIVQSAINRARSTPRCTALKYVAKPKTNTRPTYVALFDPRLNISSSLNKHWRAMTAMDPYMAEVFPQPPLLAYRRQKNIRDLLVQAKVSTKNKQRSKRQLNGMKNCGKQCPTCPYVQQGKIVLGNSFVWNIRKNVNCKTKNIIYMIECSKDNCKQRYIGQTEKSLHERFSQHRGYVNRRIFSYATGHHFNLPGHSISNITVTILEIVKKKDEGYRLQREHYLIRKFNSFHRGINRMP